MLIRIKNYTIQDITDSITFLLDRAAHSPEVRQHAIQITYDKQDKIGAVHDWIKQNVSYVPDPIQSEGEIELFISPIKQVKDYAQGLRPSGDCDDMALLATALYRAIGIRANVIIIDSVGNGLDHAFCQVWSDKLNQFVNSDPSGEYPPGWEISYHNKIVIE